MNGFSRYLFVVVLRLIAAIFIFPIEAVADVTIVTSDNPHALAMAKRVQAAVKGPSSIKHTLDGTSSSDIIIALGNEALEMTASMTSGHVLAAFVNYSDSAQSNKNVKRIIYSDPSPKFIAAFLDTNFANTRVGFIYNSADAEFADQVAQSLNGKNNKLVSIRFNGNAFDGISDLTKQKIDVMFIGRNRKIYQPDNIRFILEALFRKKVPVITTSRSLIKAGALVSIAPKDEQITEAVGRSVNSFLKDNELQGEEFITDLEIQTNRSMTDFYNWHQKAGR